MSNSDVLPNLKSFTSFLDLEAKGLRNTGDLDANFFSEQKSVDEIIALFDRSDMKSQLQELAQKKHTSGEWVGQKSQMEYTAGIQRDLAMRYSNRIQGYTRACLQKKFIKASYDYYVKQVQFLQNAKS